MGLFSGKKKGKEANRKPVASDDRGRSNAEICSQPPLGEDAKQGKINGLHKGRAAARLIPDNKTRLKNNKIPDSLRVFFEEVTKEMATLSNEELEKDLEEARKNIRHVLNYFEKKKILKYSNDEQYKIKVNTQLFYCIRSILIGAQYFLADERDLKEFTAKIDSVLERIVKVGTYDESAIERELRRIGFALRLKNILIDEIENRHMSEFKKILKRLDDEDKILKDLIIKIRKDLEYSGKLEINKIDKPEAYGMG
ncbi:hypothetical protein ACFLQI_01835 [Candidatus Undinarchaeota archaeon]